MVKPVTKSFKNFIVEVGTAVGPPIVYTAPCGFNSKSLQMAASTSSASVPDCTDPEAPAWDEVGIDSLSGQIQGAGVMATENSPMWDQWFDSAAPKPIRIRIPGVGYRAGLGLLTALGDSVALKSDGNLVQRSVTIVSSGPWAWTAGDPDDIGEG
jgi:hypothetical protein